MSCSIVFERALANALSHITQAINGFQVWEKRPLPDRHRVIFGSGFPGQLFFMGWLWYFSVQPFAGVKIQAPGIQQRRRPPTTFGACIFNNLK